jgi:hypothetical protein
MAAGRRAAAVGAGWWVLCRRPNRSTPEVSTRRGLVVIAWFIVTRLLIIASSWMRPWTS